MAFRMGGLFIQARVENGEGTFDIGSNNGFVNSLSSINVKISNGQASTIELALAPTFQQSVDIIESGFLGYGFPIEKQGQTPSQSQLINGVATPVFNTGIANTVATSAGSTSKSASLSIRLGYGDQGVTDGVAMTPWINGIIQAPRISFGQEISITMQAVSTGIIMASSDTVRNFEGVSLYEVVKTIVYQDAKGQVKFSTEAEARAKSIMVTGNQTDNSLAYIRMLLDQYNFYYHEDAGESSGAPVSYTITNLSAISNSAPTFTLVMYGQIDVSKKIYPCETFDADISYMFVTGAIFGQKMTSLSTSTKEVSQMKSDLDTYKKDVKPKGNTIGGRQLPGKPTKSGVTDGPPDLKDNSKAGKRKIIVQKNSNDTMQKTAVDSETKDIIDGSFSVSVTAPLIPEAMPNKLVKLVIFTGNSNRPIFKTLSGVYKIQSVTHSISDAGGTTQMELLRGIGSGSIENESMSKASNQVASVGTTSSPEYKAFIKGIYG